jgi:hypothetical protein
MLQYNTLIPGLRFVKGFKDLCLSVWQRNELAGPTCMSILPLNKCETLEQAHLIVRQVCEQLQEKKKRLNTISADRIFRSRPWRMSKSSLKDSNMVHTFLSLL